MFRKARKFLKSPGIFLRDFFNDRYPIVHNEIGCPQDEEHILIKHDLELCHLLENKQKIDVVFTWVDDSDPEWRERYNRAKKSTEPTAVGLYGADTARFANHDELRYSLLSVQRFMPWVNRIHVVTDQQRPHWFQPNDRLRLVDHREIINPDFLPTFNSHVIEAHLHRIPEVTEHFIYFNDDVFVAKDLPPGHFFRSNGIASIFCAKKSLKAMHHRGVQTPTLLASLRSAAMLAQDYGTEIDHPLVHTYMPLRKSIFELAWQRYEKEIETFLSNRFRGAEDLNLATFLVPWLAFLEGLATPARDICYYFNIRSRAARAHYKSLLERGPLGLGPHSFCANDFNSQQSVSGDYKQKLHSMLNAFFID